MNTFILINFGFLAFIVGVTTTLFLYWKRKSKQLQFDNNEMEDLIEEQGISLAKVQKVAKKDIYERCEEMKEASIYIKSLKRINSELEIENFKLKQKPLFKIGYFISTHRKITAINAEKVPMVDHLMLFSKQGIREKYHYIYTAQHIHSGKVSKIAEKNIPAHPEPRQNKEQIFNVESFE